MTKSSGLPLISARILKDALLVLTMQLVYLFNLSLTTGVTPQKWKVASVVPIFKSGRRDSANNYRPISLLPVPDKLLEKIVHIRISFFLETNKVLLEQQGGFRCGKSTVGSVTDFTNDVLRSVNDSKVTMAAFVDLRKAFDTVDHSILLAKMDNMGIRGGALGWLRDYLLGSSQTTFVNGMSSEVLGVDYGVPQGSILGPLLFLAYIHDVQYNAKNIKILLYADDTVLYASSENPETALVNLQKGVDDFVNWCIKNKLSLNVEKTKTMFFRL